MSAYRGFFLFLGFCASTAAAQRPAPDTTRMFSTRAELQSLTSRLDSVARLDKDKGRREAAGRYAAAVRKRLAEGDFQGGDRILLRVEAETQLSDTFTVDEERMLPLPIVGEVSLHGVLRSELEDYLHAKIARYIRDPVIRAKSLIRIAIVGEVNRPGFYFVPPSSQIEDALMVAGGPTHESKLKALEVEHADGNYFEQAFLQKAVAEGRSLDQMGIRSGDRLYVPRTGGFGRTVGVVAGLAAIMVSVVVLTHQHY